MSELRRPAKVYLALLASAAIAATLVALQRDGLPAGRQVPSAVLLAVLMTVAWLFQLPLAFKTRLLFDTSVLVAAILLVEPATAMLIAGSGPLLAFAIRRDDIIEAVFNASQAMLQAAAGATVLVLGGWTPGATVVDHPAVILLVVAAGIAMAVVNELTIALIIGLQSGIAARQIWSSTRFAAAGVERLAQVAQWGLGILGAVLGNAAPWAIGLLLLPAGAVYVALARNLALQRQLSEALQDRDAQLAEAQRLAELGNWEWNIVTGEALWSDQVFRTLGFAPNAIVPTYGALLHAVHPADRSAVDQALHDALVDGAAFGFDHRIVRPDGIERIVHQRGEVLRDESGQKRRLLATMHDVTERIALEARLAHQATHDPLTDLANRTLFLDRLARALARAGPGSAALAVLYVDLDGFKLVNDQFGHDAGDQLLVEVAARLRTCVGANGTIGRLGGDEFTILLEGIGTPAAATQVADRIAAAVRAPFHLVDQAVAVTTSIGIVVSDPSHRRSADLLRDADAALYRAKARGKACHELFARDDRAVRRPDQAAAPNPRPPAARSGVGQN